MSVKIELWKGLWRPCRSTPKKGDLITQNWQRANLRSYSLGILAALLLLESCEKSFSNLLKVNLNLTER